MKNAIVKANVQAALNVIDAVFRMNDEELDAACAAQLPGAKLSGLTMDRKAWLLKLYVIDIFHIPIKLPSRKT